MLGIDIVIPDFSYLQKNRKKIKAMFVTHGHEDHIGAIPYFLKSFSEVPIYASRLTLGLIENKLKEHGIRADLNDVTNGDIITCGAFRVEVIRMTHSIPGTAAFAIKTPLGTIFHTGDFKIDYTPLDGDTINFQRLATLGSRLEEHEIRELENLVEIYDSSYQTGCRALDVLLAERSLYCGQHGIRLTCMAEGGKLGFLSAADVYSIFGNAIDNAVTAVEALPPEKRVISLTVRENLGMLCVRVENYCEGDVDLSGGLPQTTKADRDYHGFGMKSMDYTVKKYGGTLSVKAADGLFILDILLPLP